jgi:hypothetical protein
VFGREGANNLLGLIRAAIAHNRNVPGVGLSRIELDDARQARREARLFVVCGDDHTQIRRAQDGSVYRRQAHFANERDFPVPPNDRMLTLTRSAARHAGIHAQEGIKTMNNLSLRTSFIALALVAAAAGQAYDVINLKVPNTGEQQNIVQQGVWSASAYGSIFSANSNTSTNLNLMASNFVARQIEVFGGVTYMSFNSNDSYGVTIGGRWYFNPAQDKQVLPFAGAFYTYANGNSSVQSNSFGLQGGVQYFVAPNVSITPTVVWSSTHVTGATTDAFGFQFGLTYWFK